MISEEKTLSDKSVSWSLLYKNGLTGMVVWRKSITIHQNINVSKYNHKRIIIGKNGENLKKIGISSRLDLEKVFNKKVNLFLFIKIKNNWMNNIKELNHLGQN